MIGCDYFFLEGSPTIQGKNRLKNGTTKYIDRQTSTATTDKCIQKSLNKSLKVPSFTNSFLIKSTNKLIKYIWVQSIIMEFSPI